MAMADLEVNSKKSATENFWDTEKENIFSGTIQYITGRGGELRSVDDFVCQTLPTLARQFDGKDLDNLKKANPWLASFEPGPGPVPRWGMAKSAFVDNGAAFLNVLEYYTGLIHYENMIGVMVSGDITVATRLLLAVRDVLKSYEEGGDSKTVDQSVERLLAKLPNEILDPNKTEGVTRSRIDALLKNFLEAEGPRSHNNNAISYNIYRRIFQVLWEANSHKWYHEYQEPSMFSQNHDLGQIDPAKVNHYFRNYILAILTESDDMTKANTSAHYAKLVRVFVLQVGCAKVHVGPKENIAELRLFHATTIGYFAKLQDQYFRKELEVKKLRHHIIALEFRSLLENLPDITLNPGGGAGPRWVKFWENALSDEARHYWNSTVRAPDHALESLVESRNPTRGSKAANQISTDGAKGFLYTTGKNMYSILSDEIHRYRGEEYKIEDDDGWTAVVTQILRALKPLEANINPTTRVVDWAAERLRYTT